MEDSSKKTGLKLTIAAVLMLGAAYFLYAQYWYATRAPEREDRAGEVAGPAVREGRGQRGEGTPPDREERQQMRQEIMAELSLSPEQQEKINAIAARYDAQSDSPENWRGRFEEMQTVLTPEQQEQARAAMMARFAEGGGMAERMRARMMERAAVLPPEEREKYMEKLEERIKERMERGPGGPGGGRMGGGGEGGNRGGEPPPEGGPPRGRQGSSV